MATWGCYVRVSGAEQVTNNSIPTQSEACHQRAIERGATEILDFIDAGVPGDLDWTDRPALNQLLELVEHGALTGVVIYDPDRLARDLGVQLAATEMITRHCVQLEFCTQQFDASPEGMLFYQLRGAISQFERAKIKERTNRGRKKTLRDGRPANKPSPYGLTYDPQSNTWTVQEDQAGVLRQIFMWAQGGLGPAGIAERLNRLGILPPRGLRSRRWWTTTVRRILSSTLYTGRLYIHRYNFEGQRKNRFLPKSRRTRVTQRPEADWIEVRVPPIIPKQLWEAAQSALQTNRRRQSGIRSRHRVYLASRLLRCGCCGSAITAATAKAGTSQQSHYYRCSGRYGERKLPCVLGHLRAEDLEAELWRAVQDCLQDPRLIDEAVRSADIRGDAIVTQTDAGAEVARSLQDVRRDLHRLQELCAKGVLRQVEVEDVLRNLRDRESQLDRARSVPARTETPPPDVPSDLIDHLTPTEQRACITALVREVVVHPNGRLELVPLPPPTSDGGCGVYGPTVQ